MRREIIDPGNKIDHYLKGELSDLERKEMNERIQDIDQNDDSDKIINDLELDEAANRNPMLDTEGDWLLVRKRIGFQTGSKRISPFRYFSKIAAILILAFGLSYLLSTLVKFSRENSQEFTQYLAINEMQMILLDDGSRITLNKNSSLNLAPGFNKNNRDVILDGEAFFDIARNEKVSFRIFVQNSTIEVLGTSFIIKSDTAKVLVNVLSGHVAFYQTDEKENRVELIREELAEYDVKESHFLKSRSTDPNAISWITKKLIFHDTRLNEVFKTLAGHFNKNLVININSDISETYNGEFNEQSLDEIVDAIKLSLKTELEVYITEDQIIVTSVEAN